MNAQSARAGGSCGLLWLLSLLIVLPARITLAAEPLAVKVMVINMFELEAAPWLGALKATREIAVPGLSSDYPLVRCTEQALCQMTTGMGHANAAASMMAVAYSGLFDLRQTYFCGRHRGASIPPWEPSVRLPGHILRSMSGIAHEMDVRDLPKRLAGRLFRRAHPLTGSKTETGISHRAISPQRERCCRRPLALSRAPRWKTARTCAPIGAHYPQAPADRPPQVIQCDTVTSDTWWAGPHLAEHARHWVGLLTDGEGTYCTTQEEDNATHDCVDARRTVRTVDLQAGRDTAHGIGLRSPLSRVRTVARLR